jgi:uncharacterized oligopeptide transporter (OPT) family protein
MPCFLLLIILLFPRITLVVLFFFTTYLERAYHGILIPLLGFIFVPITTIVYAWLVNNSMPIQGINLLWILLAVIVDLGGVGHGYQRRYQR